MQWCCFTFSCACAAYSVCQLSSPTEDADILFSTKTQPELYIVIVTFNPILLWPSSCPCGPLRWLIIARLRLQSPVAQIALGKAESVNTHTSVSVWVAQIYESPCLLFYLCVCVCVCVFQCPESVISQSNYNRGGVYFLWKTKTWLQGSCSALQYINCTVMFYTSPILDQFLSLYVPALQSQASFCLCMAGV